MHKPSSIRDYTIAILMGAATTALLGLYLSVRRGYLFDAPMTADPFYVPNKALAGAGVMLLALTFLIGPIARYFDKFDAWLGYRKEIGIIGCFLVIFHAFGSYFFLPLKYPREYFSELPLALGAGSVGLLLLIFLYILSFKKIIELMSGNTWWFLQRLGLRLVVLLTVIHVFALKWDGWWKWLIEGSRQSPELLHPTMAPASLLVSIFIGWVIILRIYESVFLYKNVGFETKEITMDKALRCRGRSFFIWSLIAFLLFYIFILTRWI